MKCKKFFKTLSLVLSLLMIFSLCACGNKEAEEFETSSSFEYHFLPEDYEEKYNEVTEAIDIEGDKEYQILLEATCTEGTMQIDVLKDGETDTTYSVDSNSPFTGSINVLPDSAAEVDIVIHIDAATNGSVMGEIKQKKNT